MNHFNLVVWDYYDVGILQTNLSREVVELEWRNYANRPIPDDFDGEILSVDDFVEQLSKAYPANHFARFSIDGTIDPIEDL